MDCKEHCHENHHDHPERLLGHLEELHHHAVPAAADIEEVAGHIRTAAAAVDELQVVGRGEEVEEGSCIAVCQPSGCGCPERVFDC